MLMQEPALIVREYLHINILTMEQIVASSVAESVLEDNSANSHDPSHLCLGNISILSCALFHIYDGSIYFLDKVELASSEKDTVVSQH